MAEAIGKVYSWLAVRRIELSEYAPEGQCKIRAIVSLDDIRMISPRSSVPGSSIHFKDGSYLHVAEEYDELLGYLQSPPGPPSDPR